MKYCLTCAKIIGEDSERLHWAISTAIWCGRDASHATLIDSRKPATWSNIVHTYCAEHAPADAVLIDRESYLHLEA